MAKFIISAFADEVSPELDKQLDYLNRRGIGYIEPRNIDGTSISGLTLQQAKDAKKKMDLHGVKVTSLGSPIGKIKTTDDFEEHLKIFENTMDVAEIMETKNIRMFSFYFPEGVAPEQHKDIVFDRLEQLLVRAEKRGLTLCHENEKDIYGETPDRCLEIMTHFDGRMKCVFDNGNFAFCFTDIYPGPVTNLLPYIEYMHIKDADETGTIVPAGTGVGLIPETLALLNKQDKTYLLTLEPHLKVFKGLDKLSNMDELKVGNVYNSSEEAFDAAYDALNKVLAGIK